MSDIGINLNFFFFFSWQTSVWTFDHEIILRLCTLVFFCNVYSLSSVMHNIITLFDYVFFFFSLITGVGFNYLCRFFSFWVLTSNSTYAISYLMSEYFTRSWREILVIFYNLILIYFSAQFHLKIHTINKGKVFDIKSCCSIQTS